MDLIQRYVKKGSSLFHQVEQGRVGQTIINMASDAPCGEDVSLPEQHQLLRYVCLPESQRLVQMAYATFTAADGKHDLQACRLTQQAKYLR